MKFFIKTTGQENEVELTNLDLTLRELQLMGIDALRMEHDCVDEILEPLRPNCMILPFSDDDK